MRRSMLALAAATCLAVCAAGCSAPSSHAAQGSTTGTLKFVMDNPSWKAQFNQMNKLSKKDKDIQVQIAAYSDQNQYKAAVKQSFRTKESPGLFKWQAGQSLQDLVNQGLVAETSDIWKKALDNGWVTKSLEDAYTYNGKQYCVPLNIAYWGIYYNKKIFAKYHIAVPTTWDQLMAAAAKLKANGVTPFYQTSTGFTYPWFTALVAGTDPSVYNGLGTGKTKFTDPTVVDAMNEWLREEKAGYFTDPGSDDPAPMLKRGDIGMMLMGTWYGSTFTQLGMTSDDYGFFPMPARNSSLKKTPIAMELAPMCVGAKSSQKALGLAYSAWWMTPQAGAAWSDANGDVPFNPKAKVKDPQLGALAKELTSDKYQTVWRFFEMMPSAPMEVARAQFSEFMVHPKSPMPYLEAIQKSMSDETSKK